MIRSQVTLLERSNRLGGPIQTVHEDGFVIECGADSFISEKPWALALARRLGLEDELIPTGGAAPHDGRMPRTSDRDPGWASICWRRST